MAGIWDDEANMIEASNEGLQLLSRDSLSVEAIPDLVGVGDVLVLGQGDCEQARVDDPAQECHDLEKAALR